jgi:hypothetical protein
MTDPMRKVIQRFPANQDVIRVLRDTNSKFRILCEQYATLSDKLDALAQRNGALHQRGRAIYENGRR